MWELMCPVHGIPAIIAAFLFGTNGPIFLLTIKSYFGSLIKRIKVAA